MENKMYSFNEEGVAEYVIAQNRNDAIRCIKSIWGEDTWKDCEDDYLKDGISHEQFLDSFVREMSDNTEFALIDQEGKKITLTVREHIQQIEQTEDFRSPCYFACEDY